MQVPGSNDFTVVPVDQTANQFTSEQVLQVVEAPPPAEGVVVAVPGSVGALEPDTLDTTTLLAQENPGMIYHRTMLQEGLKECFHAELHSDIRVITNDGGLFTFLKQISAVCLHIVEISQLFVFHFLKKFSCFFTST